MHIWKKDFQKAFNILIVKISIFEVFKIKIKDIRAMQENALKTKIGELNLELAIEKRKVAATGVSSKVVKIREMKKTIARIKTVLNERGAEKK